MTLALALALALALTLALALALAQNVTVTLTCSALVMTPVALSLFLATSGVFMPWPSFPSPWPSDQPIFCIIATPSANDYRAPKSFVFVFGAKRVTIFDQHVSKPA